MSTQDFYQLSVAGIREEIDGNARTVSFEVPERLREIFRWRPGQHLSFRFDIDGTEYRRSYSISASPNGDEPLRITVKRVKDGIVSNYINDRLKVGDVIEVMPPTGTFCLDTDSMARRTHYFIGAGSGVTPLYAMLRSVMVAEPHSFAHMVLGNTYDKTILLADELAETIEACKDRMTLSHVFSQPSWWSSAEYWKRGKIDESVIADLINEQPPYAQDAQYYICGPAGMNQSVKSALMAMDVPPSRIHMENYGGAAELDFTVEGVSSEAQVKIRKEKHNLKVEQGQTILEAAKATGLKTPHSCESGICGACRAKLVKGEVHMRTRMALEDSDIANGQILTCQAAPTTEEVSISFD